MAEPESTESQPATSPVAEVPPTLRPVYEMPQKSSWPIVLGIICVVFGILGVLGGMCGIGSSVLQGMLAGAMPSDPEMQEMQAAFTHLWPLMLATQTFEMVIAIVLAVGGFALISRRPWSRKTLLWWSGLRMVAVIGSVLVMYQFQQAILQMAQEVGSQDGANPMPPMIGMFMNFGFGISAAFRIIWGWALPIFVLIWMNRDKIRSEVQAWT